MLKVNLNLSHNPCCLYEVLDRLPCTLILSIFFVALRDFSRYNVA